MEVHLINREDIPRKQFLPLASLSFLCDQTLKIFLSKYEPLSNIRRRLFHHFDKLWIGLYLLEIRLLVGVYGKGFAHDPAAIPTSRFRQFIEKSI
jgi:hypothetical protein